MSSINLREKYLLSLGFVPASSSSHVQRIAIPQSCLGDVKIRIEPLKSDHNPDMDDSCHSDVSTASSTSTETIPSSPPSPSSTHSILSSSPPISIPLPTRSAPKHKKRSRSGIVKSSKLNHPTISFNESVKVLPIPLRHEYSSRIRSQMYSNAEELYRNAHRNTREFMSEGWSLEGVVEEEGMIAWGGELIHPVHLISQR